MKIPKLYKKKYSKLWQFSSNCDQEKILYKKLFMKKEFHYDLI